MKITLIRHAQTDGNRLNRALFGKHGAPLNAAGQAQAQALQQQLLDQGIDPSTEPVAVSELIRTQQTAALAGFQHTTIYHSLNEVTTSDPVQTDSLIEQNILPEEAKQVAKNILANPPVEKIWITHGLVIAALLDTLGQSERKQFIPNPCEITVVDI